LLIKTLLRAKNKSPATWELNQSPLPDFVACFWDIFNSYVDGGAKIEQRNYRSNIKSAMKMTTVRFGAAFIAVSDAQRANGF